MEVMTLKETQLDTMKVRLTDILIQVSWGDISWYNVEMQLFPLEIRLISVNF